jgi:ubiquinone/menaquinone biosynthesis C-methylase UbiE
MKDAATSSRAVKLEETVMTARDFNRDAADWDEQPGRIKLADGLFAALTREVQLTEELDVFEFGCGTGLITMRVQPWVRTIVGADSSEGMLEQLGRKIAAAQATNVETRLLDTAKGDRLEGQFDLVVISMVLHHVPVPGEIFTQFYRILRPGGRLAILDLESEDGTFHNDPTGVFHNGFDQAALGQELVAAGFSVPAFTRAMNYAKEQATGAPRIYPIFLAVALKGATSAP